jgi:RHS repeat-associated protein
VGNKVKMTTPEGKSVNYNYDPLNRLASLTDIHGEATTFTYDPLGRRIKKSVKTTEHRRTNSKTSTYVYDSEDIILEYLSNDTSRFGRDEVVRFTHGPGLDEPISMERKNRLYYYHFDGLGSVTELTNSRQRTVSRLDYDSFGIPRHYGTLTKNPYAYTGREYDPEIGLYYYRNRYYDPRIGRFITQDPLGMVDGPNLYTYVNNNPVNWVDPWGLCVEVGYKRIIGIGDYSIWHIFIKVAYQGNILMMGFNASNNIQIPFTMLGIDIPGVVKVETDGQEFKTVSTESMQAMIVYNILNNIEESKQFNWRSYNYATNNCYDWVSAVLGAAGIDRETLPWG